MASEPTLSSLAQLAESSSSQLRDIVDPSSSDPEAYKALLRRQYVRTLHKVVDESDIVLLVLDARDPAGCRSRLVEEEVRRREHEGKRLIFVLNKVGTCRADDSSQKMILTSERSGTSEQCRSLAPLSPPLDADSSVQVFDAAAAFAPDVAHRTCTAQSSQVVQTWNGRRRERHGWRCRLSECREEQPHQLAKAG